MRVNQPLPAEAVCGVHEVTGTVVVTVGALQAVTILELPKSVPTTHGSCTGCEVKLLGVHVMRVHLGVVSAVGVCGVHETAGTNALALVPVVQVIEVQLLPAVAV